MQTVAKTEPTGKLREELKTKFMPEIDKTPLYSAVCSDDPLIFDELLNQIKGYMEEMDYGTLNSIAVGLSNRSTVRTSSKSVTMLSASGRGC